MQSDSRVGRQRSFQILAGEDKSPRSNPQLYPTHFRCRMGPENKRTFNPRAIEKSFTQETGSKPATIRWNSECEFVIEISNEKKSKILPNITSLCSPHFKKGSKLIYSTRFDLRLRLQHPGYWWLWQRTKKKEFNLLAVKKTTLIKTKNITCTLLLLTFKVKNQRDL